MLESLIPPAKEGEGKDFIAAIKQDYCLDWEVVERDKQSKGFKILPWRWKLERSFACLRRYRRLAID